jgi:hypothetical protein
MDHCALVIDAAIWNEKPLTLADRFAVPNFGGAQVGDRRPYIVDIVPRHGGGEQVALIAP